MIIKNQKGQSLFEVLFATALAALIVTGVASISIKSLRNAEFARKQSEARQLAQNLLEEARIERDDNPNCIQSSNCGPVVLTCPEFDTCEANFSNYRPVSGGTDDTVDVTATVEWTDSSGAHTITAESVLTAWQD